ncbi:hypothetical protein [Allorhodopirellula solitaria]|uniref:HEAT repeat protein n=1 Tax=Allorhodopirellula solitaria TaxID=2527987 RepID=A0A5C5YDX3_9BACT|nr:hypothetical protein [Allorhodopirellula solitaria]TWT73936.1 hypothetical protein CA85_08180 [Allorhodopirellula solitaria]
MVGRNQRGGEQSWLAITLFALAFTPAVHLVAQETPAVSPSPAASPQPAQGIATFSQPHLAGDQIAAVFREQARDVAPGPQAEGGPDEEGDAASGAESAGPNEVSQWVDQLGWTEFAVREKATAKLRALGKPALPDLRLAAEEHADLEVRVRARDVADGIASTENAGRIDAFLAGQDVPMEGWDVARTILGDGGRVRELFVEIVLRHESAAAALEGATADRSAAFRATIIEIQRGMYVEQRLPTEADVITLLLLANDRDMPVSQVEEDALFSVLQREATAILLQDAQLSGLFRALLGGWATRGDIRDLQKMLWFALNCDLSESLPLALETLQKSTDPPTLAMAMQAVARFGDVSHVAAVAKFLDDERAASDLQYFAGNVIEPQLRDSAMATIVLLSDQSLADFDLDESALHPKFGFVVQAIGFPAENNELRLQAIEKVKRELVTK